MSTPRRTGVPKADMAQAHRLGRRIHPTATDKPRFLVRGEIASLYSASMPDGSWTGATLVAAATRQKVTLVAKGVGGLQVGRVVEVEGYWDKHPDYGVQLIVEVCRRSEMPTDAVALVRYLSASVGGVGPRSAELLVRGLGCEDVLRELIRDPEVARRYVTSREADRVVLGLRQWKRDMENEKWAVDVAPSLMQAAGVTYVLARRILNFFGSAEVADLMARQEPYRLLDVPGIGWTRADAIAKRMGVQPDAEERFEAAVLWSMRQLERRGHSAATIKQIVDVVDSDLIPNSRQGVRSAVARCLRYSELVRSCGYLFRMERLQSEWEICHLVEQLLARRYTLTPEQKRAVETAVRTAKPPLTHEQAEAVRLMASRGISVLTGRPGTGKTHTLRTVVAAARALGLPVQIIAPTGKAAARATEMAGLPAKTVHKLIGGPAGGTQPAPAAGSGVLVLEEASMIDADVFAWLARNTRPDPDFRLVIVGDNHQLPSVGHGKVLEDLLTSNAIATTRLSQVQRAAAHSRITIQAHRMLDGQELLREETHDWRYVELPDDPETARTVVVAQVRKVIQEEQTSVSRPAASGRFDARRELQLLAPRVRHALGVEALNREVRRLINGHGIEGAYIRSDDPNEGVRVRVGDRVICVENDYSVGDEGLMNGEQGVVTATDRVSTRVMLDSGRTVTTRGVQNNNWSLAFCTSVHRSQGSEFPVVVFVYHSSHWPLVDQRLLYTAITRARRRVILCADRRVLELTAQRRGEATRRNTGLALRVRLAARRVSSQVNAS